MARLVVDGYGAGPNLASRPTLSGTTFREAVNARLLADVTLTAIVGARVYPIARPQRSPLPALVCTVTGGGRVHNLAGAAGVANGRVEFAAYAKHQADAAAAINCCRLDFDGFRGMLSPSVEVLETHLDDEHEAYVQPQDGSDEGTFILSLEFTVRYREATS